MTLIKSQRIRKRYMLMKMLVKKLEMATLLTGKVDFRAKKITREEVHYILRQ